MGCWNATCTLSNLPIHSGEKILAIPIAETHYPHNGNYPYPDSIYSPIMPPLYGSYDGYGSIENCDNLTVEVVEGFFQTLKENDVLCGIDSDDSLQDMFGLMCRGDVYFQHSVEARKLQTSVAFVRQDIFETLSAQAQNEETYCQLMQEFEAQWEKIQAWPKIPIEFGIVDAFNQLFWCMSHTPRCYLRLAGMKTLLKSGRLKMAKKLFEDLVTINYILSELRQGYRSTGGAGSQETFTPLMKKLHTTCLNIIDQQTLKHQQEE